MTQTAQTPNVSALIDARDLVKTYQPRGKGKPVEAVRSLSFTVQKGSCTGLLGPNGAGKSTTMKMLMGLTQRTSGSLTIFGTESTQLSHAERCRVGLVPQEDNLDPDLTVRENLLIYGMLFGISKPDMEARVPQLLQWMQLTEKADARVNQLSGGMKRRLTIARGLVNDPELLILDEPTTGLDPQARVMIWQRLLDLKKQGKTLLLTTHYMDEAQRLCDHIIMIDHGQILAEGSPAELIKTHVKKYVFEVAKPVPLEIPTTEHEDVGDAVLFYVEDAKTFRTHLGEDAQFYQRPANMEDVFLRLTGRKLRE
jgi:lipooligosaccharide transport system ATP-binding protein